MHSTVSHLAVAASLINTHSHTPQLLLCVLNLLLHHIRQHLDPAALTKARARAVSNNMMATAAVMSGLHFLVHANSWRLLVGVRRFAKEVLSMYGKLPTQGEGASGGAQASAVGPAAADGDQRSQSAATAAAIRLAANAGVLGRAAIAAESAGASKETVLAAAAAAASKAMAAAAAGALGAGTAAMASRLSQDVLDDDTLWMAVWLRRKELAALQAAAAKAAKEAAAAAAKAATAGPGSAAEDAVMADAATDGDDIARELQQRVTAAAEAEAGTQVAKRKFPKVLADLVESLTAAVYVDSGGDWESTWRVGEFLLCRHQEEVERLEAQQQQTQQQAQVQQQGDAVDCEESDDSDEEPCGLLMLLPQDAE